MESVRSWGTGPKEATLRSPSRRLLVITTAVAALLLVSAACSKKADNGTTSPGASAPGTVPTGANIDYSSLKGEIKGSGATFPKTFYENSLQAFKAKAPNVSNSYAGG